MEIIRPNTGEIIASTAPISFYDEWVAGDYEAGDFVYLGEREYVAGLDTSAQPPDDPWIDIGAANKFRCIDDNPVRKTESQAWGAMTIIADFDGVCDRVVLYGMEATAVDYALEPKGGGTPFVEAEAEGYENLQYANGFATRPNVVIEFDERTGVRARLTLIKNEVVGLRNAEFAKIGAIIAGRGMNIGRTIKTGIRSIKDFSSHIENEFGVTQFVQRGRSRVLNASVEVARDDMDEVSDLFEQIRSTPVLIDANNTPGLRSGLIIFGTVKCEAPYGGEAAQAFELEIRGLVE